MTIEFPGGARAEAHFDTFTVRTDQPLSDGGSGSAPTPFDTFLASIGTCAGTYVLGFCRQRGISMDGVRLVQRVHANPSNGMVDKIDLEILVPPDFPERYRESLVRAAELCAVKKHLEHPPAFQVISKVAD
jgi:ribosomal protein S12 methylthiotransferase accessory factor